MTETIQTSHGPFVPSTTLVQTDQVSILGDGSHDHPLRAVSGAISVVTDGTTILGNGTTGNPLHTGNVPVTTDGTTILGNGTTGDPLRSSASSGSFQAAYLGGSVPAVPGRPVFVATELTPGQATTVEPSTATNDPSGARQARADGVIAVVNGDGTVQVQSSGLLTLTTAEWDAVTGGSGGLVNGTTYYVDIFPAFGAITSPASDVPGMFVVQVGVATSPTTMLISTGDPVANLGDIIFSAGVSLAPLLGSAVRVDSPNHVVEATSNISLEDSQAVGVVAAFNIVNSRAIVQIAGPVVLTTAQWDAVTDTVPGMVAGTAYYVDTSANPGHLTSTKPITGAVSQVGVGFSETTLLLSTPCFPLRLT